MNTLNRITVATLVATLGISGLASADPGWGGGDRDYTDTAKVLKVRPIYETVTITRPERRCWQVDRPARRYYEQPEQGATSYTTPLLGALIGGVIGNQFGRGSGNTAMTAAGALLGASVGNDIRNQDQEQGGYVYAAPPPRRRCETIQRQTSSRELAGYRVTYRYQGHVYHTRMKHRPGDTIQVSVAVTPVN